MNAVPAPCERSEAIQYFRKAELLRRFAPRNDAMPARSLVHSASEQRELLRAFACRREVLGAELELAPVQAEPLACRLEAAADHPGDRTRAGHPLAPFRVVILAATHVADQLENVALTVGEILP